MKFAICLLFFSLFLSCKSEKKKSDDIINASRILSIVKNGSLQNYLNMVDDAGYKLIDGNFNHQLAEQMASKGTTILYNAEDSTGSENIFSCVAGKDFSVKLLRFFTPDKQLFNKLNKQIIEAGFKAYDKEVDINGSTIEYKKDNSPVVITMRTSKEFYNIFFGNKERFSLDRIRNTFLR